MAERNNRPQPAAPAQPPEEAPVQSGITEAETATNRTGVSEDIDNQVYTEMNSLQ